MKKCNLSLMLGLIALLSLILTGCNYQVMDFEYTFDYAIINLGGEYKKVIIDTWKDYEGEQLQIKDKEGNVYLTSSFNCTLVKEDK